LRELICEVVSWRSETGTSGEIEFAYKISDKLHDLPYFQEHPTHISLLDAEQGRHAVTALYKSEQTDRTIVLISHFDTVHTAEFGELRDLAFQPEKLTATFRNHLHLLPETAQEDLLSGDYLFGRGVMDMKMGLVLHLHLLEKASREEWPINLLLVTVPDEEVNSSGMRAAVPGLLSLAEQHDLRYELFLNSEPSFDLYPNDPNYYIYSGTIGKIMPTAYFYGRETHVGEPFGGLTGQYMASFLTQEMEFNILFQETVYDETTPVPVVLKQIDLKKEYSTQTSHRVATMYNVFLMKRNAQQVMDLFKHVTEIAMKACNNHYVAACEREGTTPIGTINVIDYGELERYAIKKHGADVVEAIKVAVSKDDMLDEREKTIQIVDRIMLKCQELAPVAVVFFTPPYYPAINSTESPFIQKKIADINRWATENFNLHPKQVHYFNGISDLSYVNYNAADTGWSKYKDNMPLWNIGYSIPFEEMQQLQAPVLNVGPYGKDPHKLTERLNMTSAFVETPYLLTKLIKSMFAEVKTGQINTDS